MPEGKRLEHEIGKGGAPAEACPSFGKPVNSSGLESRNDCKLAVQIVKLMKSLGHLSLNRLLVKLNHTSFPTLTKWAKVSVLDLRSSCLKIS